MPGGNFGGPANEHANTAYAGRFGSSLRSSSVDTCAGSNDAGETSFKIREVLVLMVTPARMKTTNAVQHSITLTRQPATEALTGHQRCVAQGTPTG